MQPCVIGAITLPLNHSAQYSTIFKQLECWSDTLDLGREAKSRKWLISAAIALLVRPKDDGFTQRHFPLQCFVCGIELRVLGQRLELGVIALAPLDITAEFLVADALDALIANIFTPEFHDAFDLPQHVERCSALGLLSFAQGDIFIDHAIDAAVGERQTRLLPKFD